LATLKLKSEGAAFIASEKTPVQGRCIIYRQADRATEARIAAEYWPASKSDTKQTITDKPSSSRSLTPEEPKSMIFAVDEELD
jgi:hypothetical protein